ncbi:uncharacterized protein F4812DRAFT_171406 [Daldinia caldariorum]|uniref:uncharacterized protein n=1 Tax=Daldinia caldariorum TaxID=326644 RepID=UPI002008DF3F|nr:uncharacterized protein F4812DRAFT_171406 [Daldinia caldariorum]KAI1471252.1 hypothetical protein F4812DRAFT_171406 [Daldinia caldariorum]
MEYSIHLALADTAKQLRRRMGEPEPRESTASVPGGFLGASSQNAGSSSAAERGTQGLRFDNLPYDVKASIFDVVGSSPSWAYFRFRKGSLAECWGGDQALYVNKEWNGSHQLRQGLNTISPSISRPIGIETLTEGILRLFLGDEHGTGKSHKHSQSITVRKHLDWFLYDGCVNQMASREPWSIPSYLSGVRFCAFKLDDVFDSTMANENWDPPPNFIWPRSSRIEELIIVVGRFRREVPPSRMRVIKAFQTDTRSISSAMNLAYDRMLEDNPDWKKYLANSEKHMIGDITERWTYALFNKYQRRQQWLEGYDGQRWLAYPVHDEQNELSVWLASAEGYDWLGYDWSDEKRPGFLFLASKSCWWWLASEYGFPWLETRQGIVWLNSRNGRKFLASRQALLWANTGTYTPSHFTPLGTQVRKAWFSTPTGREWAFYNCPNGNPPTPPEPYKRESTPPPEVEFPAFFTNRRFRQWKFVICPEEITERAARHRR